MASKIMSLILFDDTKYDFDFHGNIPTNLYEKIKVLKCVDCNLSNIDFISLFPNLKKINASHNKITTIPIVVNIEELEIYNNELTELPPLPNLKILYAFNNKLKSIINYPNLEIIDVSHNNISKISLGEKIKKLHIGFNSLVKIEINIENDNNIEEIECNNNLLQDVNFIHGLNKLNKFNYDYNPIKMIPIHIRRIIRRMVQNINKKNIDSMDNPIHNNHSLDTKTTNKILKIINLFYNIKLEEYNIIKNDIMKYKLISPEAMKLLKKYTDDTKVEPTIRLTYLELFICLWDVIIIKNIKKLNNVLLEKKDCYCITCLFKYLATLIN